jgi:pimeloyl-ACP methyl ester carboxylesterase
MEKTIVYNGKNLVYSVYGSGPAVVLLHGFGETGSIWNKLLEGLAGYYLIIPQLPGSGLSDLLNDMSMESLADSVYAILKEEAIEKCVLIGHSMGGYITLSFVAKYAAMLVGFGLFHSTAFKDDEEKIATRKKRDCLYKRKWCFALFKNLNTKPVCSCNKNRKCSVIRRTFIIGAKYF